MTLECLPCGAAWILLKGGMPVQRAPAFPICHWKVQGNEESAIGHVADAGIDGDRSGCPLNRKQIFCAPVR